MCSPDVGRDLEAERGAQARREHRVLRRVVRPRINFFANDRWVFRILFIVSLLGFWLRLLFHFRLFGGSSGFVLSFASG